MKKGPIICLAASCALLAALNTAAQDSGETSRVCHHFASLVAEDSGLPDSQDLQYSRCMAWADDDFGGCRNAPEILICIESAADVRQLDGCASLCDTSPDATDSEALPAPGDGQFRRTCDDGTQPTTFTLESGSVVHSEGENSWGPWETAYERQNECVVVVDDGEFECDGPNITRYEFDGTVDELSWSADGRLERRVSSMFGIVNVFTYEYGPDEVIRLRVSEGDVSDTPYRCVLQDGVPLTCTSGTPGGQFGSSVSSYTYTEQGNLQEHRVEVEWTGDSTLMRRYGYDADESMIVSEQYDGPGDSLITCNWDPPLPVTAELVPESIRATEPTSNAWFFPFYYEY